MMTRKLSVMLLTFLISVPAFSKSVIESEFELKLPRQFQQSLIEEKWKSLMTQEFSANWQFPDQRILSQDIPVDIRGISVHIRSHLEKPALHEGQSALELTSKNLQGQIHIAAVTVDHVIERNFGGIIGRFRVRASCRDITLNLKNGEGQFGMVLLPQVSGAQAGTQVQSVSLSWQPGSWVSGEVQCEGAQGFDELLLAEVGKIADNSAAFVEPQKNLIKKYVQDYLQNVSVDFSKARKLVVARPDIEVLMTVSELKDLGESGLIAKGIFEISFERVNEGPKKLLKLSESTEFGNVSRAASLRLPKDFVKTILEESYKANTWMHRVGSEKLPGFATLMNSRFSQFFVWPELLNYSKSSKFIFDLYSNKDAEIQGKGLQYQVNTQMYAKMQAPRSGKYVPFMNFSLPFKSSVQFKIDAGKAKATFENPTLGMMASYEKSYISQYDPSTRFKSSTIRDRIVGALWGQTTTIALPSVPVAEGISLQVKKLLTTDSSDLVLQLAP